MKPSSSKIRAPLFANKIVSYYAEGFIGSVQKAYYTLSSVIALHVLAVCNSLSKLSSWMILGMKTFSCTVCLFSQIARISTLPGNIILRHSINKRNYFLVFDFLVGLIKGPFEATTCNTIYALKFDNIFE